MLLNNQLVTKTQRGNQNIPRDKRKWKHSDLKPVWQSKSSSKREVYNDTSLSQKTRKTSKTTQPYTSMN